MCNRWSPAEFAANWSTPQLIFHNSKDYRLVEAEGLAAFHVLQQYVPRLNYHLFVSV